MTAYRDFNLNDRVVLADPSTPEECEGQVVAISGSRVLVDWGHSRTWAEPQWLQVIPADEDEQ
jgi:FKBP-type peptidyl-prolyl cis-trans isomerase 2